MSNYFSNISKTNKFFITCSLLGCIQAGLGALLVRNFNRYSQHKKQSTPLPKITVFKPLAGNEPLLKEALQSFCEQDYPNLQIIFGIQHKNDSAIPIIKELQQQYSHLDINLVIDESIHGDNRKVSNLINMANLAKHDIFIISDSDIHAPHPQYLWNMVALLNQEKVGLVTSLYSGLSAKDSVIQQLGCAHINYIFLPGVLLSRHLKRQDCLGATIAIKKNILETIGGFQALLPHVADDAVLGRLVLAQNLNIALSPDIVQTTVTEETTKQLYEHELRWNKTIATLEPISFFFSFLQLPLLWATLSIIFNPLARISWMWFLTSWIFKSICCLVINNKIKSKSLSILPILPYRDWLSAFIMMKSFFGKNVQWRGQKMTIHKHPEFQTSSYNDKT